LRVALLSPNSAASPMTSMCATTCVSPR